MTQQTSLHRSRREVVIAGAAAFVASAGIGWAEGSCSMKHVALLGDSVFANAAYVAGGPDVVAQLRQRLGAEWSASLAAVDGAVMADIPRQLETVPSGATHLVVSTGGNDALGYAAVLGAPSRSVADSLEQLAQIRDRFLRDYRAMIETVLRRGLPAAFCTIYDPRYPDPAKRRIASTALCVLNDAIIRETALQGVPLLDLRLVCNDDRDFANAIEPSTEGGWKIAGAIVSLVTGHDFARQRSEIFVG